MTAILEYLKTKDINMTEEIKSSITKHDSFIESHPRYEFIPLTREDFNIGEWIEGNAEYDSKWSSLNDPSAMKTLTLNLPFSKDEIDESFLSFNVIYLSRAKKRSWKGVPKLQSKRQKLKDELFEELREDLKENGEKYIDERIAEVNASIQKVIDRLNEEYRVYNSEMMLNAFERIDTDWIKEEIYDYSEELEEEKLLKYEISKLTKKLNSKKVARYRKVNDHLADFLENDKDALDSIDEELRSDICQKLRLESPKMPITRRY